MTKRGGAIATFTMMVFCFILLSWVIYVPIIRTIIVIIVIILMSMWVIHDTQMIIGGKKVKYQLDVDDYIIGAIIIYSDIVTIFLYLLELFGGR